MQVYDKRKRENVGIRCTFGEVEPGTVFVHRGRALVKVVTHIYRLDYTESEGGPQLIKVNAVRLGPNTDEDWKGRKISGLASTFNDDTEVFMCKDAALYLKG